MAADTAQEKEPPLSGKVPNELLIYAREQRGWSQQDVADRMEDLKTHKETIIREGEEVKVLSGWKTIGKWERGEIARPHPHSLSQLEQAFGKTRQELGYADPGKVPFMTALPARNPFFVGREDIFQ